MQRLLVLLALLSLFDPPRVLAGNRFHERNHTGLLVLYGFDDGQRSSDLHPTSARDYTGQGLLGNLTTSTTSVTWNVLRQGMQIPLIGGGSRAISQRTTVDLCNALRGEFSIEIFVLNPENVGGDGVVIAGFGDWSPGSTFPVCNRLSPADGGWRLFTMPGNSIRFQAVMSLNGAPNCVEVGIGSIPTNVRHAIFRAKPTLMNVVSHGSVVSASDPGLSFNSSFWSRHPTHLQIAVPQLADAWTGTMYMLAIFDRFISNDEAAQNRIYGPPNSLPVATATDASLATTEDITTTLYP